MPTNVPILKFPADVMQFCNEPKQVDAVIFAVCELNWPGLRLRTDPQWLQARKFVLSRLCMLGRPATVLGYLIENDLLP